MSTNHRLFIKKEEQARFHYDDPQAINQMASILHEMTAFFTKRDLIIICIGTDRSTGDSLGPLIGSKLEAASLRRFHVYGTLEHPFHAVNMEERLEKIKRDHWRPFIIAIDACLGQLSSVGYMTLAHGPVQPGAAVSKKLPPIGDIHMTGIVNVGGMMEFFVLQNTRLHTVMEMADSMAKAIVKADQMLPNQERIPTFFEALKRKGKSALS
ncbi:spore protease YyaC [Halalkalibacter sp. APA_J-10(15)]|uniref:spore protease YyaC n=1 Tax=Halalkalibacter sp. APA_J-10(15) TaxID=2933805 RepID=UPI001FF669F7|nr:spore protease YyaC [Halalkalibacter sp. APA_J-10(15)]MCK0469798.1 spore protease YyaC [Halalkalibacter sp. APA_J-10(15)]